MIDDVDMDAWITARAGGGRFVQLERALLDFIERFPTRWKEDPMWAKVACVMAIEDWDRAKREGY